MIIDDSAIPVSPTERSPLKNRHSILPSPVQAGPPPPPYSIMPGSIPYHSVDPPHDDMGAGAQYQSTGKRFLKAFGVALLVIFLWGMLVDSMDIVVNLRYPRVRHRITGSVFGDGSSNLPVLTAKWSREAPTGPPPERCSPVTPVPQIPVMPGQALPRRYPPVIIRETPQLSLYPTPSAAERTALQPAPSPTALKEFAPLS